MEAQAGNRKIDPHSNSFWWNHLIYRLIEQAEWFQPVRPELLLALFVCSIRPMGVMVNNHHHHEIKMLGDGSFDPFGFYGRPMIIDLSA